MFVDVVRLILCGCHPPGAMNCAPTFLHETALLLVVLIVVDLCVIIVVPAIAVSLD
jgi:hypothetical protein